MWRLWNWFRGKNPNERVDRGNVNANIAAENGARVIAPVITHCSIQSLSVTEGPKGPGGHTGQYTYPETITEVIEEHKSRMRQRYGFVFEGLVQKEHKTPLQTIYTPLYITTGESEEVNSDHEIWQIETAYRKQKRQYVAISINDIFRGDQPHDQSERLFRTVMTKGVAGVGKTVSVQKFILDWAGGEANEDVHFVICLPFRELNLLSGEEYSLQKLMLGFNAELRQSEPINFEKCKVVFILDGLDECRFPLNFRDNIPVFNITDSAPLDVLLTNVLKGNLLQSSLVWITSRPAAAAVVPSEHIDRFTEVRGFNDEQKSKYFRNKFGEGLQTEKIISHVKTTRSLYIMCHIPVFCCITATVMKDKLEQGITEDIPKTLTEMYTDFLFTQLKMANHKFVKENISNRKAFLEKNKDGILKLAELAFRKLEGERGSILFYEDDLQECGIDLQEASVLCGLCTEIFKVEPVMFEKRYYSFVHLSIQEFLAALHIYASFLKKDMKALSPFLKTKPKKVFLYLLLKSIIDKALKSNNGHLDLFVRFLVGLCVESNNKLLVGLLPDPSDKDTEDYEESMKLISKYIKSLVRKNLSPERFINLMNCLTELKDDSVRHELERYLQYTSIPEIELEPTHCSALANMILLSDEPLEEFDFERYNLGDAAKERLVPAVRWCKKARLAECKLSAHCGEILASALQADHSPLRELELKRCPLTEPGLRTVCSALTTPHCRLQALSLEGSRKAFTDFMCVVLGKALSSVTPHLTELNLSHNLILSDDIRAITAGLKSPSCKVQTLRLQKCSISAHGCELLAGVLRCEPCSLTELDLRDNALEDSAVALLSAAMRTPQCHLQKLRLAGCNLTETSWRCLTSAFRGELDLSESSLPVPELEQLAAALRSPDCRVNTLRLRQCFLKDGQCAVLASALSSDGCQLTELDLSDNDLQDSGVELLSSGLQSSQCTLEILRLSFCGVTERGCACLDAALRENPSHLRELDLSYNHPGDAGVQLLSHRKDDPACRLDSINVEHGAECWLKSGLKKYACELTFDPDTAHRQLRLSEEDRRLDIAFLDEAYPDHRDRYLSAEQALCRQALTGRCYWEAEWSTNEVYLGAAYRRDGQMERDSRLGRHDSSWGLLYQERFGAWRRHSYMPGHDCEAAPAVSLPFCSYRVGAFLDHAAGTLSFYSVSADTHTLTHLHTFHHQFTEPVYAGFGLIMRVVESQDYIRLCRV